MLPIRPGPEPDESLVGYIVRLASRNGRDDVMAFAREQGIPFSQLETAGTTLFDLSRLAAATGVPRDLLAGMAAWPIDRHPHSLNGRGLSRQMISLSARHACPDCLRTSAHHRAIWDVALVTVCAEHATSLISACPCCRRVLGWTSPIRNCACGYDLAACRSARLPADQLAGVRGVIDLLGMSSPYADPVQLRLPQPTAVLEADACIRLIWHLGWFAAGGKGVPRAIREAGGRSDLHEILTWGYHAARGWPRSFHDLLDHLRAGAAGRPGRCGARKELGPIARWASSLDDGDPVRAILLSGLDTYPAPSPFAGARTPILRLPRDASGTVNLNRAAARLRVSKGKCVVVLGRMGLLVHSDGRGRGAPILAARSAVEELARDLADLRDKRGIARQLGCGRKVLEALLEAGLLCRTTDPSGTLGGPRCLRSSQAAALVRDLEDRAVPRPGRTISFTNAFRRLRTAGRTPGEAVRILTDATLAPAGVDPAATGLGRVLLHAGSVAALAVAGQDTSAQLSVQNFAATVGMPQELAYRLCRSGLVITVPGGTRKGRSVPRSEVDRFRREFVLPGKLADGLGRHKGWVSDRLVAAGFPPASGPGVDGGRHYVFRAADVERWRFGRDPALDGADDPEARFRTGRDERIRACTTAGSVLA